MTNTENITTIEMLTFADGHCYFVALKLQCRVESRDGCAVFHCNHCRKVRMQKGNKSDCVVEFGTDKSYTIFDKSLNELIQEISEYLQMPIE